MSSRRCLVQIVIKYPEFKMPGEPREKGVVQDQILALQALQEGVFALGHC